ncbi:MAG: indole-3-glycerol phosphate synthase TrpC [Flammeovirgaceae bacterium]
MNILDKIIAHKKQEVERRKQLVPSKILEKFNHFQRNCLSAKDWLLDTSKNGIIAEFKRKSPSKGFFNTSFSPVEVAKGYFEAGCSAMSILTDEEFFAGKSEDLEQVREKVNIPLLRKDFIIDEYQLVEAKAIGADLILLIAANLSAKDCMQLAKFAHSLGLQVLLEVHDADELASHLNEHIDLVGVNNRNLKTFSVSLDTSYQLVNQIPSRFLKISESGIDNPKTILELKKAGFHGFLIGENFMKTENPPRACLDFANQLKSIEI